MFACVFHVCSSPANDVAQSEPTCSPTVCSRTVNADAVNTCSPADCSSAGCNDTVSLLSSLHGELCPDCHDSDGAMSSEIPFIPPPRFRYSAEREIPATVAAEIPAKLTTSTNQVSSGDSPPLSKMEPISATATEHSTDDEKQELFPVNVDNDPPFNGFYPDPDFDDQPDSDNPTSDSGWLFEELDNEIQIKSRRLRKQDNVDVVDEDIVFNHASPQKLHALDTQRAKSQNLENRADTSPPKITAGERQLFGRKNCQETPSAINRSVFPTSRLSGLPMRRYSHCKRQLSSKATEAELC